MSINVTGVNYKLLYQLRCTVGAGFVPAALGPISESFDITKQQASYLITSYTLLSGLTPLLITPLSNVYGRKPMYIVGVEFAVYQISSHKFRSLPPSPWLLISAPDMPSHMLQRSYPVLLWVLEPALHWLSVQLV